MTFLFSNQWLEYVAETMFLEGTPPASDQFYFAFADTNALSRTSTPTDVAIAELKTVNGYARTAATFEQGLISVSNRRYDFPTETGSLEASGATLQFQTVILMANANSRANTLFNAATDVDATANTITIANHGLSNGEDILLTTEPASSLPGGLAANTTYKALSVTTNTFQVSSDGLNSIDIAAVGSGQLRLRYVPKIIVGLEEFDEPQLIQSGREFFYDLSIAVSNATYGVGL